MPRRFPPGPSVGLLGWRYLRGLRHPLDVATYLATFGDLVHSRLAWFHVYVLNHPDLVRAVLIDQRKSFRKYRRMIRRLRTVDGDGLVTSEGDLWSRQRRLVQPAFDGERLDRYAQVTVDCTRRLGDTWGLQTEVDIAREMTHLTLEVIAKSLFGVDLDGRHAAQLGAAVRELSESFMREIRAPVQLPDWAPLPSKRRKRRALQILDDLIRDVIRRRRASGVDEGDLLSMLLLAVDEQDGTGMTDRQARDEAMTLFNAGHDSTAAALAWIWFLVAEHADVQARLRDEAQSAFGTRAATFADLRQLVYTERVVKESLRLYPSTWALFARETVEPVKIGGYRMPKGSLVYAFTYARHRDPRYFPDPTAFDPDRFAPGRIEQIPRYTYFPFGVGPHTCIGNHFAMMEMTLIVATLLREFRVALAPDQGAAEPELLIAMRPKGGVRVTLTKVAAQKREQPIHADSRTALDAPIAS